MDYGRYRFLLSVYLANGLLTVLLMLLFLPAALRLRAVSLWQAGCFALATQALFGVLYLGLSFLPAGVRRVRHPLILGIEGARLTVLVTDLLLFSLMGIHLYSPDVLLNLRHPRFWKDIGMSVWSWLELLGIGTACGVLQGCLWVQFRRRFPGGSRPDLRPRAGLGGLLLGLLVPAAGYFTTPFRDQEELARYLPGYRELHPIHYHNLEKLKRAHLDLRKKLLRYPLRKLPSLGLGLGSDELVRVRRPHILLLAAESLRADMLNGSDMPALSRWLAAHPALLSEHHFSGGHQTWEGTFSLIYALYGYHRSFFNDQPLRPYPILVLRQLGYRAVALTSGSISYAGYRATTEAFDEVWDISHLDAVEADRKITERAASLLGAQRTLPADKQQPLFLLLFYNATHYPYPFPASDGVFKPYRQVPPFDPDHDRMWNRYRNSVRYLDRQIGELLGALEPEWRQGKLAVSFVGDHGEEFWDQGLYGHGNLRLNDARIQTPLLLAFPGLAARRVPLSSHVDVLPTLFELMGVPLEPSAYSDGQSLLRPRGWIEVNGFNFPEAETFALVTPRYKIFSRRDPSFRYELNQVLDLDDRPTKWTIREVGPAIQEFLEQVDHFYPGHHLFRSRQIVYRPLPGYPFDEDRGPIRSNEHPERTPWARTGKDR